jgi:hypothetical protein
MVLELSTGSRRRSLKAKKKKIQGRDRTGDDKREKDAETEKGKDRQGEHSAEARETEEEERFTSKSRLKW